MATSPTSFNMAWITCNMGKAMSVSAMPHWLVALCAVVALLGLATHVMADATRGFPDPIQVSQGAEESNAADVQAAPCDLLADSALPATVSTVSLEPLVFLLNHPSLTRLAWFSPPPVRPPILLN